MADVVLPELGEGIEEAVVAVWHVKTGDPVKEGDDIVEMVTDKASFQVPANSTGVMKNIYWQEGDTVKVGSALAVIG